jgi:hypothetical protein
MILSPDTLPLVAGIAALVGLLALVGLACLIVPGRRKEPPAPPKPVRVIPLPMVNPSHDPMDKPDVVAVSRPNPKMTPLEALQAANANREAAARMRAEAAAWDLLTGRDPTETAADAGYSNTETMRKALARYGYRANGQPKKVPHDPS